MHDSKKSKNVLRLNADEAHSTHNQLSKPWGQSCALASNEQ